MARRQPPDGRVDGHARSLTPREREVLTHIADGLRNREIAERLGLSVRTVEKHRERISRKLSMRGTARLTQYAILMGIASLK